MVIGGLVAVIGMIIGNVIYDSNIPEAYFYLLIAICCLFQVASGISMILFRELPRPGGLPNIKGLWAIISGVIWTTLSSVGLVIMVKTLIIELLK